MTVDLHYELTGPERAPVLVLSHALGLDAGMWTSLTARLGSRFRLLLADTRGHGGSPARWGRTRSRSSAPTICGCSIGSASRGCRGAGCRWAA